MRNKALIPIVLLVFVSCLSGNAQEKEAYQLSNQLFYNDIFDYDAQQDFEQAESKELRGKELQAKADERYDIARKALKRKKAATSSGTKNKADRRYRWKKFWGDFYYKRALRRYKKADGIRFDVYDTYIKNVRLNDDSKYDNKGHSLENNARELFLKAKRKTDNLPDDRYAEIMAMKAADSLRNLALQKMQLAFGVYKKDSTAANRVFKKEEKAEEPGEGEEKVLPDVVVKAFEQDYSLSADRHVYRSIKGKIFRRLELDTQEQTSLEGAYRMVKQGDTLYRKSNRTFREIIRKNRMAEKVSDESMKEQLKSESRSLQMQAFVNMIEKAELYLRANQRFLKILQEHFSDVVAGKQANELQQARRLTQHAVVLKNRADSLMKEAEYENFRADKYRILMNANKNYHEAIQEMEAAYAMLLDLQLAENDVDVVSIFDLVSDSLGQEGVTEEKGAASAAGRFDFEGRYKYVQGGKVEKAEAKDELVFRIQAGIMRNLPQKARELLPPVFFDAFKDNPLRRFYLGEFQTLEASKYAQDIVHNKLYEDAFVVPFLNGKRISEGYAKKLIDANKFMSPEEYNRVKQQELAALGDEDAKAVDAEKVHVKGLLEDTKGLVFTVQLGIFDEVPVQSQVADIDSVYKGQTPIGNRYTFGHYSTFEQASKLRNEIATNAVNQAFVVAYNDGAWIDINKARGLYELKEEEPTAAGTGTGDVVYRVQIGAFKESGRFEQLRKKMDIKEIPGDDGMISYSVGEFDDYSNALDKRDELLSKGIEGFVVAYKGKSRIALTEAKETEERVARQAQEEQSDEKMQAEKTKVDADESEDEPGVSFHVQVGVYSNPLKAKEKEKLSRAAENWSLKVRRDEQNRYLYFLGTFDYYEQALNFQKQLQENGVNGFVAAYKGKERLSLEAARKMSN